MEQLWYSLRNAQQHRQHTTRDIDLLANAATIAVIFARHSSNHSPANAAIIAVFFPHQAQEVGTISNCSARGVTCDRLDEFAPPARCMVTWDMI